MATNPTYSQPLPEQQRDVGGPVVYAGFVGDGPDKVAGFIFRNDGVRPGADDAPDEVRVAADSTNVAKETPRGFMRSLAALYWGRQ